MALIFRFVQQKFCYHQWITVWIGRDAAYDVCLLCRKRIVDREGEYERILSRGVAGIVPMCDNGGDRPERQHQLGSNESTTAHVDTQRLRRVDTTLQTVVDATAGAIPR